MRSEGRISGARGFHPSFTGRRESCTTKEGGRKSATKARKGWKVGRREGWWVAENGGRGFELVGGWLVGGTHLT